LLNEYIGHQERNPDFSIVVDLFQSLANSGNSKAQLLIAFMYYFGCGINQNVEIALKWLDLSGVTGRELISTHVSRLMKNYNIMDDKSAFNWCQVSAGHGNVEAQYTLGYAYHWGKG